MEVTIIGTTTDPVTGVAAEVAVVVGAEEVDTTIHGVIMAAAAVVEIGATIWVEIRGTLRGRIKVDSPIKDSTIWV